MKVIHKFCPKIGCHGNVLPWQRPLKNLEKSSDRSPTNKYLSNGEKIVKSVQRIRDDLEFGYKKSLKNKER